MAKTFTLAELLDRCIARQAECEDERDDAIRYAAWMRSSDGQICEDKCYGTPEDADDDAEFFDEEACFFAALARQLRPIGRRQRILVDGSNH